MNEIKTKLANAITNPPSFSVPKKNTKKAKVIYAYSPQNDDELALEVGQTLEVLKQEEPGWWEGNLSGRIGMFPSNFVELVDKDEPSEVPEIKGRKIVGVGFGPSIFESGHIVLRPVNPVSPPRDKQPIMPPSKGKKSPADPEKDNKPVLKAKVIYEYKAENPDELHLNVGDVIVVLDQNLEDVGWWKGDLNGKIGVFPDNFVELMPSEEKPLKRPPPEPDTKPKMPTLSVLVPLNKSKHEDDPKKPLKVPQSSEESIKPDSIVSDLSRGPTVRVLNPGANLQKSAVIPKRDDLPTKPLLKEQKADFIIRAGPSAKPGSVTLEMFANLQKEVDHLKEQLDKMKKDHEKTLLQLMSEIDEEKKNRFNIQVEIDRIKKLITSSSAS